jgi:hypothetical protein
MLNTIKNLAKRTWDFRKREHSKISFYHFVLCLILFFLWLITQIDIYVIVTALNLCYTIICCWSLFAPRDTIDFWIKNAFIVLAISTQSAFVLLAGLIEVGINLYLAVPAINFCLSIAAGNRLANTVVGVRRDITK